MTSLRDRLRAETAPWHERVDHAYSTLDLTRPPGLGAFLGAQLAALLAIAPRPGRHAEAVQELRSGMILALREDLRSLGQEDAPSRAERREVDATSALYILLGARLGTRVLHRRWQESADAAAAKAGRYLGLATPATAWRAFCADLTRLPDQGPEADRVVGDACLLFDLHLDILSTPAPAVRGGLHAA